MKCPSPILIESFSHRVLNIYIWISCLTPAGRQCFCHECTNLCCLLFRCLAWIDFWIPSWRHWTQSEWQRSLNASSMLISLLSSLPCSSSACLESCTLQIPSLPHRTYFSHSCHTCGASQITSVTFLCLCTSLVTISLVLFTPEALWSAKHDVMFLFCSLVKAEWKCVFQIGCILEF